MSIKARVRTGTILMSASRVLTNVLASVSTLVLARLLVPEDFGLVALATVVMGILAAVTDLSVNSALVGHRNPTEQHLHTAWSLSFCRGLVLALILCAVAYPASLIYKDNRLVGIFISLSVSVVLSGLANPRMAMLSKELRFKQQFALDVARKLGALVVSVTIAVVYKSYWALVWGMIAGQGLGCLVSYTMAPFRPRLSFRHAGEIWAFSVWLSLAQIINTINWRFDQLFIGGMLGSAPLGLYTVGDNLARIPTREATTPISQTLFPAFSKLFGDPPRLAAAFRAAQSLLTSIALPAGVGLALVAEPLVRLTMGEKWLPTVIVIQCIAPVYAIQTIGSLAQPLAMAAGETRTLFRRDLFGFALRVPFVVAGALLGGLHGILFARVVVGTLGIGLNLGVVKRLTGIPIVSHLTANIRTLAAVMLMAAAVAAAQHVVSKGTSTTDLALEISASLLVGAAAYAGTLFGIWHLVGRPSGAENEILGLARGLLKRLRPGAI